MVVSSFLLCDQLSERLEPSLFLCNPSNDVYFYRAMLRKAQYCC